MSAPKLLPSNHGISTEGKVAFSNAARTWVERFDLISLAKATLESKGHTVRKVNSCLLHPDSGFILLPRLIELQPLEPRGVRTVTTIQVHHPALVPDGIFEYQHSNGDDLEGSFREGFVRWAETDFVTLLEALRPKLKDCTSLKLEIPERNGEPAYSRRAVLGPFVHVQANPKNEAQQTTTDRPASDESSQEQCHDFCPCCLLTNSFEAFRELFESNRFYGLRMFAMRNQHGVPEADCRVNGDDWVKGKEALLKYVETWPGEGFEFRKQYVILQTVWPPQS